MAELLIEILCEEIPAKLQKNALEQTRQLFSHLLDEHKLTFNKDNLKTFISPRRITIVVENLSKTSKDMVEEKRGPKTTAALPAIQGFLKANNLNSVEELVVQNDYYFAHLKTPPQPTQLVIPKVLEAFFANFKWSKSMYWGQGSQSWIRPIRNILCIFDEKPVEHYFDKLELISNNKTFGHRFLDDNTCLEVKNFNDYQKQLEEHHVIFDQNKRKKIIEDTLQKLADAKNLLWQKDDDLLEEVVGLTEYPCVEICKIDEKFLELPPIVITTCMKNHQKYFSFADSNNQSITHFGIVSNVGLNDKNLAGFTKVLKARLTDALFFYEQDLKTPLINLLPKLNNIQVHEKLGSVGDKIRRINNVIEKKALEKKSKKEELKNLVSIYKCDLATNMVREFPELQGIMGDIYHQKQEKSYLNLPIDSIKNIYSRDIISNENTISEELYILDRVDTLVNFVGMGIKPTGSKDPYGLRRTANEIAKIIIKENNNPSEPYDYSYYFDLDYLIDSFIEEFKNFKIVENTKIEVINLIKNSIKTILLEKNDLISSCFNGKNDFFDTIWKYKAIKSLDNKDFEFILENFKRLNNIIPEDFIPKQIKDYQFLDINGQESLKSKVKDFIDNVYRWKNDIQTTKNNFDSQQNEKPFFIDHIYFKDSKIFKPYSEYLKYIQEEISPALNDFLDNVQVIDPKDEKKTEQNILLLVLSKKMMLEFYNFELILQ